MQDIKTEAPPETLAASADVRFPETRALDALRAFGAITLAFIFHHLYYVGDNEAFFTAVPPVFPFAQLFKAIRVYGEYIVDLMYCVSGFTICLAYKAKIADGTIRAKNFAVRRAARLYPLHLLTLILTGLMTLAAVISDSPALSTQVHDASDTIASFVRSVFLAQDIWTRRSSAFNDPSWTLSFYLIVYIIFYAVVQRSKPGSTVLRFAICAAVGTMLMKFIPDGTPVVNYESGRAAAGFFSGCLTFELHRALSSRPRARRVCVVVSACAAAALLCALVSSAQVRYSTAVVLSMRLFFFPPVLILVLNIKPLSRFLSLRPFGWLGNLSFSIYLWHLPVVTFMKILVFAVSGELKMTAWTASPMFFYCWVISVVIISHMSHYYFERRVQKRVLAAFAGGAPPNPGKRPGIRVAVFILAAVCFASAPAVLLRVLAAKGAFEATEKDGAALFINRPDGYSIELPLGFAADLSLASSVTRYISDDLDVTVSREWSPYDDVDGYIAHYLNRFITDEGWRAANDIDLLADTTENIGGRACRVISLRVNGLPENAPGIYTYVTLSAGTRAFLRLMFRERAEGGVWRRAVESLELFSPSGLKISTLDPTPVLPETWTPETREYFEKLRDSESVEFGIFERSRDELDSLEAALNYKFQVMLDYLHLDSTFPLEYYEWIYASGRTLELTLQTTDSNNLDLFGRSPMLDIYRGDADTLELVRGFARGVKELARPVLIRLNNEMNTDWCSYSGIANLSDPDIYVAVWRSVYDIFREEGADNAIWVWNPNNANYPPCRWNNFMRYYPGGKYVQLLGVTGYNTGTYYSAENSETWREFREIYDEVQKEYESAFGDFPWIITEFASSSFGGDKAKWIDGMFESIGEYGQIKLAVWFNANDYDTREGREEIVSRSYKLTDGADLEVFRRGLERFAGR
ncbi:MAG: acyltransferase family protein [Oscillospiraceae bacterium]|jgi:peptidoglycan/LPS O-acetylase OafA/YrhL|nr:acyltransferase family protein [Oscillospiraceae bacterium]